MTESYGIDQTALEQRVAELSDDEFDALVSRTRPPKVDPADVTASIAAKVAKMYSR